MSGWTEREFGSIKLKHHSTSSLIEMTITSTEELVRGIPEEVKETVWFNYETFSDLREIINKIDFP